MSKIVILILILSLMLACSARKVDFANLQYRDGLYFHADETRPFTGTAVEYSADGQIIAVRDFKKGLIFKE